MRGETGKAITFEEVEYKTHRALCIAYGINENTFGLHRRKGMRVENCVYGNDRHKLGTMAITIIFRGVQYKSLKDMCDSNGITPVKYYLGKRKGMTLAEVVDSAVKEKKTRVKEFRDFKGNIYRSLEYMCFAYSVEVGTFLGRRERKWNLEECLMGRKIAERVYKKPIELHESFKNAICSNGIKFNGRLYATENAMCEAFRVNNGSYRTRKSQGASMEESLFGYGITKNKIELLGEVYKSEEALCRAYKVKISVYRDRKYRRLTTYECIFGKKEGES